MSYCISTCSEDCHTKERGCVVSGEVSVETCFTTGDECFSKCKIESIPSLVCNADTDCREQMDQMDTCNDNCHNDIQECFDTCTDPACTDNCHQEFGNCFETCMEPIDYCMCCDDCQRMSEIPGESTDCTTFCDSEISSGQNEAIYLDPFGDYGSKINANPMSLFLLTNIMVPVITVLIIFALCLSIYYCTISRWGKSNRVLWKRVSNDIDHDEE